jgi:hypothetical protein
LPARAHGNGPAPQTERDKGRVEDQEAQGEMVADEAAHKTSWGEDFVQLGDVLLDRVGALGENQEQKDDFASVFHKTSFVRC